jgi:carboxypeptidase T
LLSFHSFSELILYPWGHSYDPISQLKDRQVHEVMAKKMSTWNGYTPQQASQLYIASGDTTDWSYGEHRIISFTFELDPKNTGFGGGGFYPGAKVIPDVIRKNIEPALYLIEHADNPYRVLD